MNYPPCVARADLSKGSTCLHKSAYYKEQVTPEQCSECPFRIDGNMPSLPKRAKSLVKDGVKILKDPTPVSKEIYNQRLSICLGCHLFTNKKVCKVCGCFMPIKSKFQIFDCPLGKWSKTDMEDEKF